MAVNFTDTEKTDILKLYASGFTLRKISEKFFCSSTCILRLVRLSGVVRPPKMTEQQFQAIKQRYLQGESKEKISLDTGISINVFSDRLTGLRGANSFKLTEQDRIEIREKYLEGIAVSKLAIEYKVSENTIYLTTKGMAKCRGRNRAMSTEKEMEVYAEYMQGVPMAKLGLKYRVSPPTIKNIIRRVRHGNN